MENQKHINEVGIVVVQGFNLDYGHVEDGPCLDSKIKKLAMEKLSDKSDDYFVAWCSAREHYWLRKIPGPCSPNKDGNIVLFFKGKVLGNNIVGVHGWDMKHGDLKRYDGDFNDAQDYFKKEQSLGNINSSYNMSCVAWSSDRKKYWHKTIPGPKGPNINSSITLIFQGYCIHQKFEKENPFEKKYVEFIYVPRTWTKQELLGQIMQGNNEDLAVKMLNEGLPDNFGINEKISKRSVLNFACFKGRVETVKLLIKLGADVESGNRNNETCLHSAVQGNNIEVVKILIKAGANTNARDDNGKKPINFATQCGNPGMVGMLQCPVFMDDEGDSDDEGELNDFWS